MARNHERIHIDEKNLCHLCVTELKSIYTELDLTGAELDIPGVPRRVFTVHFPVSLDSGTTREIVPVSKSKNSA